MSFGVMGVTVLVLVAAMIIAAVAANAFLERQARQQALAKLESYEWTDERERQLSEGWRTRIALPVLESIVDRVRRLTPQGYREKAARRLSSAGMPGEEALDRFLTIRIISLAAIVPALPATIAVMGTSLTGLAVTGFVVMLLVVGPTTIVTRKADDRNAAIARALPDVLDLLTISVEAGLGFEQAVDRVVASIEGPLTDEFALMLGEVRAGARRADALRALAARLDNEDVRGFVMAILQADTFGVSIGRMLRNQADEIRVRRRQQAQEKAQKAPVKMLVPMVFCIFPAILVVILGPAGLNIAHGL